MNCCVVRGFITILITVRHNRDENKSVQKVAPCLTILYFLNHYTLKKRNITGMKDSSLTEFPLTQISWQKIKLRTDFNPFYT